MSSIVVLVAAVIVTTDVLTMTFVVVITVDDITVMTRQKAGKAGQAMLFD